MTHTDQGLTELRENLIEPEEAEPEENVITIAVSRNHGFSDSIDGDSCGQDCSHEICAC